MISVRALLDIGIDFLRHVIFLTLLTLLARKLIFSLSFVSVDHMIGGRNGGSGNLEGLDDSEGSDGSDGAGGQGGSEGSGGSDGLWRLGWLRML